MVVITTHSVHNVYAARALFWRFLGREHHCLISLLELDLFFLGFELLVDVGKLFFEVALINLSLQYSFAKSEGSQSTIIKVNVIFDSPKRHFYLHILTFDRCIFEGCFERSNLLYLARCQAAKCRPKTWPIIIKLLLFVI